MSSPRAWLPALAALAASCGAAPRTSVEQGAALFQSTDLSPSSLNMFSCATCHDAIPSLQSVTIKTGAPLAGATLRPTFWGGQVNDLLEAINDCRTQFMESNAPLAATDPDAEALYAYLLSLAPGDPSAAPFTVVTTIADVPRGDANAGLSLFTASCRACHGEMHTGQGRLSTIIPVLPEETLAAHATFDAESQRLIFIEKIRHGGFLGYGGDMPPYSAEVLSDGQVSDLLEALGVLGT